jgi:hypothetical protein
MMLELTGVVCQFQIMKKGDMFMDLAIRSMSEIEIY